MRDSDQGEGTFVGVWKMSPRGVQ